MIDVIRNVWKFRLDIIHMIIDKMYLNMIMIDVIRIIGHMIRNIGHMTSNSVYLFRIVYDVIRNIGHMKSNSMYLFRIASDVISDNMNLVRVFQDVIRKQCYEVLELLSINNLF